MSIAQLSPVRDDPVSGESPNNSNQEPEPVPAPHEFGSDPGILLTHLGLCVAEILAGARSLEQIGRWVTDPVYTNIARRSALAARARAVKGHSVRRPRIRVGEPHLCQISAFIVEGVVVIHQPARSRSITIRMERYRDRWRATSLSIL